MNYYEHHIRDYDAATAHLTWDQDMAYTRLLRWYYRKEQPVPADVAEACRQIRVVTKVQRDAVQSVLAEFFVLEDDGWHQRTCDSVINDFRAGEPEREVKKGNEELRLKRHRDERASLFKRLNAVGQHASWNTPIKDLRELVERACNAETATPATAQPKTATRPATAPATPATATHTPVPSTHSPVPSTQTPGGLTDGPPKPAEPPGNAVPLAPIPAADAAATTKGKRLPKDWKLPKPWGDWALAKYPHWTAETVRAIALKFRNHWVAKTGKDATKLDWQATWENWADSGITHREHPKPATARNVAGPPSQAELDAINAEATRLVLGSNPTRQEAIDA